MTLEVKMEFIQRYEQGQRTANIIKTGISESTLRTVQASKDRISACIAQGSSSASKCVHNVRSAPMNDPQAISETEPEPEAKPSKPYQKPRQFTLYESLLSTSPFRGFKKPSEEDLPDLQNMSDSDNE